MIVLSLTIQTWGALKARKEEDEWVSELMNHNSVYRAAAEYALNNIGA